MELLEEFSTYFNNITIKESFNLVIFNSRLIEILGYSKTNLITIKLTY